jgi:hypothetical protein
MRRKQGAYLYTSTIATPFGANFELVSHVCCRLKPLRMFLSTAMERLDTELLVAGASFKYVPHFLLQFSAI